MMRPFTPSKGLRGPVRLDGSWHGLGPRSFWEPFAPTGRGGQTASSPVIVLGVVGA